MVGSSQTEPNCAYPYQKANVAQAHYTLHSINLRHISIDTWGRNKVANLP